MGAPDAEAKFQAAVKVAQAKNVNAIRYPSIYAWHGSALRNWHSIIRNGLWFKDIANGRSYGDGVYFAKDAAISVGSYAHGSGHTWLNSKINAQSCIALAEIVNLPGEYVSINPFLVVNKTEWIVW